jgi:hypothetical protein
MNTNINIDVIKRNTSGVILNRNLKRDDYRKNRLLNRSVNCPKPWEQ